MRLHILFLLLVAAMVPSCRSTPAKEEAQAPAEMSREDQLRSLEEAVREDADASAEPVARSEAGPHPGKAPAEIPGPRTATYEPEAGVVDACVAVVNGDIITREDVLSEIAAPLKAVDEDPDLTDVGREVKRRELISKTLMMMVERKLAVQEARRVMTEDESAMVEANVERMMSDNIRRAGTSTKLEGLLAEKGTTLEQQKQAARDNRLIRALLVREVDAHINVTPAEMLQYYDAHKAEFSEKGQVLLRQIFLRTSDFASKDEAIRKANDLVKQIQGGADFARLARENSRGPYAAQGGLWDWAGAGAGTWPEPVEKTVFSMAPKEVRGPIVTDIGVHIVKVEDVRPARTAPFVEVQDSISANLYEGKRRERYREFIKKIWDRSHVEIRWR